MGSFVAADASTTTTSVTTLTGVTWPAHNADDVAIVGWASDNTQTRTEPPSGFTSEFTNADGSLRAIVASLDSTGSESGDVSLICGGANRQAGVIALYRGYNPSITNVTSQNETSGTGVTSHSSPSITPADSGSAIVLIYMDRVTSSVVPSAPAGYTIRASIATGGSGGTTAVIADKLTGLTAGVPESPAAWTGATSGTAAYVVALELVPSTTAVTGTVAVTQAGDSTAASGVLEYSGTAAPTQAADTSSASGVVSGPVSGTATTAQASNTATASGNLGYSGTAATTQAANTAAAAGQLGYSGTAAASQASNTATASGVVAAGGAVVGSAAATQANQVAAAAGILGYSGTAAASQADQTATAAGILQYTATIVVTQGSDTASATGIYFIPVTGTVAVAQASQSATAAGVALGNIVFRPDEGVTTRPTTGATPRPFTTTTLRP